MSVPANADNSHSGLPNAHGVLEYAEVHGERVVLRGWMVDAAGPFASIGVTAAGRALEDAAPIERPDLAASVTTLPRMEAAGFHAEVPLELVDTDGRVEFELVGRRDGDPRGVLRGGWLRSAAAVPIPPAVLSLRVAHTDLDYLLRAGGVKAAFDYRRAAARHGVTRPARVLDWGSGFGRVTAHLAALYPGAEVIGTDLDHEALRWAAEHHPGLAFVDGEPLPPLPFEDASFDLITGGSVFTHLTRPVQEAWLAELKRLLRPDGLALVTTLGNFAANLRSTDRAMKVRLADRGFDDNTLDPALDGVAPADYYRATWQTPEWTREHWGRVLRVLEHEAAGYENYQDLWVLGH